jgi:hypothetical protein
MVGIALGQGGEMGRWLSISKASRTSPVSTNRSTRALFRK